MDSLAPPELDDARGWARSLAGNTADVKRLAACCLLLQARHSRWSCDAHTQSSVDSCRMSWSSLNPGPALRALSVAMLTSTAWPALTQLVPCLSEEPVDQQAREQAGGPRATRRGRRAAFSGAMTAVCRRLRRRAAARCDSRLEREVVIMSALSDIHVQEIDDTPRSFTHAAS